MLSLVSLAAEAFPAHKTFSGTANFPIRADGMANLENKIKETTKAKNKKNANTWLLLESPYSQVLSCHVMSVSQSVDPPPVWFLFCTLSLSESTISARNDGNRHTHNTVEYVQ